MLAIFFISFFDKGLAVGLLIAIFLTATTFCVLYKLGVKDRELYIIISLFFLVHLSVVLFIYLTGFQPFSGGADYDGYHHSAVEIAQRFRHFNFYLADLDLLHYFPVIIGLVYAISLPKMIVGQLFLVWIAVFSAIFLYFIILEIGGSKKSAFFILLIFSFYPSFLFFSSLLLKDSLVVLLSLAGLLLFIKMMKDFTALKFLAFFAVLTCLIHFRFYIGFALMFSFVACWFFLVNLKFEEKIVYGFAVIFLLGFSPYLVGCGYFGAIPMESFLNKDSITNYREVAYAPIENSNCAENGRLTESGKISSCPASEISGTSSSFNLETGFGNKYKFITNYAISFVYSFLGPFPWQLKQKSHLFFLLETIPWYFIIFLILRGMAMRIKKNGLKNFFKTYKLALPLLVFSLLALSALSLFINNFGIIVRIRMPVFSALMCLLALNNNAFEKYVWNNRNIQL